MSNVLKDGYRKVKLKEVCDEITVGYVGPMAKEYVDDGILFLRSQNIREFHLDLTDVKYISEAFHKRIKKSALSPGDIVVIRTGYPGITCVIPKELKVLNCADLVIFRPSKGLNPLYLALVFNSNWGKKHIAGRLVGVAQQHFNVTVAKEVIIELPPRSIQDKIAAIMGNYDDLIENNLRRIKILEEMARLIYREWFVHFRFPGHEGVRMVDSPMGMIPEGWVIRKLADITLLNEISIRKDSAPEEIFYIDISSVSPGRIDKIEKMKFADASSRARRVVNHGDIIWSCVRPNRKSYSLIINPIKNLIVSTGFAVVTARELPFTFLYGALTTEDFVAYLQCRTMKFA